MSQTVVVPSVAWIHVAPVKGLALLPRRTVVLERHGVVGDRRLFLVDETGRLVNGKRTGRLFAVVPQLDGARSLTLTFPGGAVVTGPIVGDERVTTSFYGRPVGGRVVEGDFASALSEEAGMTVRLVVADEDGAAMDRGPNGGAVTMLGLDSLDRLAEEAGVESVDGRRFRMLFGIEGLTAHGEDTWIGSRIGVGEAEVDVLGNVGRCVVTTRDPDTGESDLPTLQALSRYRGVMETTEPLPFGVVGRVATPGRVSVGDPVSVVA